MGLGRILNVFRQSPAPRVSTVGGGPLRLGVRKVRDRYLSGRSDRGWFSWGYLPARFGFARGRIEVMSKFLLECSTCRL